MSVKNNRPSGYPSILFTFILLLAFTVVTMAVINLFVVPIFNSSQQPATVSGSLSEVARATATIDVNDGPPPPGTPTGELPKPLPTLDTTQLDKIPTSEVPPDVPTLEPETDINAVAPTIAAVVSAPRIQNGLCGKIRISAFLFSTPAIG